jgi:hypothetical protein
MKNFKYSEVTRRSYNKREQRQHFTREITMQADRKAVERLRHVLGLPTEREERNKVRKITEWED